MKWYTSATRPKPLPRWQGWSTHASLTATVGESRREGEESEAESVVHDSFLHAVARSPRIAPSSLGPGVGARPDPDLVGGALLHFRIVQLLGAGGMGLVYKAIDEKLRRPVAIKVLSARLLADERHRDTLLREARNAAAVNHSNIASIHEVHDGPEGTFLVMELVQGETLRARLSRTGPLPVREALKVATEVARGLAHAHASGVVHRDLKCENVMVTPDGHVKLLDFGVATVQGQEGDAEGGASDETAAAVAAALAPTLPATPTPSKDRWIAGTPGSMAPEQARGEPVDARADVFAFGVMVYAMISGKSPFADRRGKPWEWDNEQLRSWTPRGPLREAARHVPRDLERLVMRCLSYAKAERPIDGAALVAELERLQLEPPSVVPSRSRRWFAAAGGVALVAAAAALAVPVLETKWARRKALAAPPPTGMALIDVGTMTMGRSRVEVEKQCKEVGPTCDAERLGRLSWQVPERRVTVRPFYLDKNEVTNTQMVTTLNALRASLTVAEDDDYHFRRYVRFNSGLGHDGQLLVDLFPTMGGIEYTGPSEGDSYRVRPGRENWPAAQVSWFGARLYCVTQGKRLPTEDEWEAAARGAANRTYPWGDAPIRCGEVAVPADGLTPSDSACVTAQNPRDVGQAQQDVTPEGIRDLAGNLNEWVDSAFGRSEVPPESQDVLRVTRGGSYAASLMARTSVRSRQPPNSVAPNTGFRCALSAVSEPKN
jgi:serine/threonine protein kinase